MNRSLLTLLIPFVVCASIVTAVNYASADKTPAIVVASSSDLAHRDVSAAYMAPERVLIAQADTGSAAAPSAPDAGSASAPATGSAIAAPATPDSSPQLADVSVATKLWKSGAFFAFGIMSVYVLLFAAMKVDKKRAFYWATAFGGVAILVESIRKGDSPSVAMTINTLLPTVGILIAGPNHTSTTPAS